MKTTTHEEGTRHISEGVPDLPTVLIVDDEASFRSIVGNILIMEGYHVAYFSSAEEILETALPCGPSCILLDVVMPGMTGIDLQELLAERESCPPIVFISGASGIPETELAMKRGAVGFLEKPFQASDLLSRVQEAIRKSEQDLVTTKKRMEKLILYKKLTKREKEVIRLVAKGYRNLEIAYELNIKEITVLKHKRCALTKLCLDSRNRVVLYIFLKDIER